MLTIRPEERGLHVRNRQPAQGERAFEVQGDDALEVGIVDILEKALVRSAPGIVDERIDAAEDGHGLVDQGRAHLRGNDVAEDSMNPIRAERLEPLARGLHLVRASTQKTDAPSRAAQGESRGEPDPFGSTRDDSHLVGPARHCDPPRKIRNIIKKAPNGGCVNVSLYANYGFVFA